MNSSVVFSVRTSASMSFSTSRRFMRRPSISRCTSSRRRLRLLQQQVALAFGFADDQAGFGLRVLLDVVGELLRGEQRVAQVALLAAMLAEHRVELGDVLAQLVVLAQRVLVVVGDLEQERLHFAAIVAAHHGLEALLPEIEWCDFHA